MQVFFFAVSVVKDFKLCCCFASVSIACVAGLASASVASSAALALALAGASTTTSAAIDAISYEIVVVPPNGVPQQLRAIVVA